MSLALKPPDSRRTLEFLVTLSSYHLPAPVDWQAVERFACGLFSAIWDDPRAQANGRSGVRREENVYKNEGKVPQL